MANFTLSSVPFERPVTVRVKGQSKRLTRVTLHRIDGKTDAVAVRNGKRGRPLHLPLDRISEIKTLATA